MSAFTEFVQVTDVDGKSHVVRRAAITSIAPLARVDGYSFSPGAIVRLRDGTTVRIYDHERAALESSLLQRSGQPEEMPRT